MENFGEETSWIAGKWKTCWRWRACEWKSTRLGLGPTVTSMELLGSITRELFMVYNSSKFWHLVPLHFYNKLMNKCKDTCETLTLTRDNLVIKGFVDNKCDIHIYWVSIHNIQQIKFMSIMASSSVTCSFSAIRMGKENIYNICI
jgi:hypothetical protein